MQEVQNMLALYGGYSEVIEKTVRYYIEKTDEWKLEGDDKYCLDAKQIAEKILNKQKQYYQYNSDTEEICSYVLIHKTRKDQHQLQGIKELKYS